MRLEKGFTLVEILISIAVGMVILLAVYAAVVTGQRSTSGIERKVIAGQDARAAMELMAIEIQMASFNPPLITGIWKDPADCASGGSQGNRGIQAASATAITIEADIDESGAVGDASNEIITYTYVSDAVNGGYITRRTGCNGGAQPFLGDTEASGNPRNVRVINDTAMPGPVAVPVFRYYNGQNTELTSFPGDIPNIARIEITLWVETESVDPNLQERRRVIYATSVIPRNHVIGMQ